MLDAQYYEKTDEIIAKHTREERSLIPIIQDIQEEYRYLPPELLTYVAKEIGITEAKAFSVASFYENFSFDPNSISASSSRPGVLKSNFKIRNLNTTNQIAVKIRPITNSNKYCCQ